MNTLNLKIILIISLILIIFGLVGIGLFTFGNINKPFLYSSIAALIISGFIYIYIVYKAIFVGFYNKANKIN
jgi:hypothetical protein